MGEQDDEIALTSGQSGFFPAPWLCRLSNGLRPFDMSEWFAKERKDVDLLLLAVPGES